MPIPEPPERRFEAPDYLVAKAKSGDREAFSTLDGWCRERVRRRVQFLVRDHSVADDIVQDAFVKGFQNLGDFQPGRFCAWISRIAFRIFIDRVRKGERSEVPLEEWLYAALADDHENPLGDALKSEFRCVLRSCIANLPADAQVMLKYKYDMDLKLREIAELVYQDSRPEAWYRVDKEISKAKEKLKNCLRGKGYGTA